MQIVSTSVANFEKQSCVCGHCNHHIALEVYAQYVDEENEDLVFYLTGQCPFCDKPIIYDVINGEVLPYVSVFEKIKHLPKDIEALYDEITRAFAIGAYTCSVISARTLMGNVAVQQGAKEGEGFSFYVEYLQKNCLPAKTNNEWVKKIRDLATEAVHHLVIATKQEAEISIKFIIAILKNVYEFPNSIC